MTIWKWWHVPLILVLGRQKQADLCELEANPVYIVSSRTKERERETKIKNKTAIQFWEERVPSGLQLSVTAHHQIESMPEPPGRN